MSDLPWRLPAGDRPRAESLARTLGISPVTAQLLINRGLAEVDVARRFLAPRLAELRRPDGEQAMAGFSVAVARLERALRGQERIGLFGDYDVDGVTSCALLALFLRAAGGEVVARVARRDRGYGVGVEDVAELAAAGCRLIVTSDCGTSDFEAVAAARAGGIDVIIVDHHQVPERDPGALALINPHQPHCGFPFKGLASVGVAFYLAAALRTRLKAQGGLPVPEVRDLLDLVALGTVADMAPLSDENRILTRHGLVRLREAPRPGLLALGRVAGIADRPLRSSDIGLKLAPRLNAPGRLGDAAPALALLLAGGLEEASRWAEVCEAANDQRRLLQERVLTEAMAQAATQTSAVLVVAGHEWHAGVVGIVAAKLVDRFRRPAFVVALDGAGEEAEGRGSARSTAGFHLVRALTEVAPLLTRYGGHAEAAGLTLPARHLPALRAALAALAARHFATAPTASLPVDTAVALAAVDEGLVEELGRLEPFGSGNPEPLLCATDLVLERSRVVGQDHLQVTLRDGLQERDGIGFGLAACGLGAGARVEAAFVPELDYYRGVKRLRVRLRALRSYPGAGGA